MACDLPTATPTFADVSNLWSKREEQMMTKLVRLICCALIALPLFHFLSVIKVRAQATHTIIAASGEAASAGGNYTGFLNTLRSEEHTSELQSRGLISYAV